MLKRLSESSGNVLGFEAIGEITKEDYADLTAEVQALVDSEGSICLLIDLEGFKSEASDTWRQDMEFGRTYHEKIAKLAVVGDKTWQHLLANLADPFFAKEAKSFATTERQAAWDWLRQAGS